MNTNLFEEICTEVAALTVEKTDIEATHAAEISAANEKKDAALVAVEAKLTDARERMTVVVR